MPSAKYARCDSVAIAIIVATCLAIAICLGVPLGIRSNENANNQAIRDTQRSNLLTDFKLRLRTAYQTAFSGVLSLEAYVIGSMNSLPNNTDTNSSRRIVNQTFQSFNMFAIALSEYVDGIKSMQLQPSGVINQAYPNGSAPIGLDVLYKNTTLSPSLLANIIDGSQVYLDGPRSFVQGGFGFVLRKLVYDPTTVVRGLSTWWGTVAVLVDWDLFFAQSGIEPLLSSDLQLIMYNTDTGVVFYRSTTVSWTGDTVDSAFAANSACTRVLLPQNHSWTACVVLSPAPDYFSSDQLLAIIFSGIVGPAVLGVFAILMYWYVSKEYDGREHAPKRAPLVYTWIGIHRAERLWDIDQADMERVRDAFAAVVARACQRVRGYQAEEAVGCYSIATRSIDAAIHFGFLVGEELKRNPILIGAGLSGLPACTPKSDDLQSTSIKRRGSTNRLPAIDSSIVNFQCLVHLCNEASVHNDADSDRFRYEGDDVMYATKMFSITKPNVVCLTQTTARHSNHVKDVEFVNLPPISAKGGAFVMLTVAVDTTNPQMWESALAELHLNQTAETHSTRIHMSNSDRKNPLDDDSQMDHFRSARIETGDPLMTLLNLPNHPTTLSQTVLPTAVPNMEGITLATLNRMVSKETQATMRRIYDYQAAISPDLDYEALKTLFYTFYVAYSVMFRPFADVERRNIYRKLVSLFGVPPVGEVLESLAVRCAVIASSRTNNQNDMSDGRSSEFNESSSTSGRKRSVSDSD